MTAIARKKKAMPHAASAVAAVMSSSSMTSVAPTASNNTALYRVVVDNVAPTLAAFNCTVSDVDATCSIEIADVGVEDRFYLRVNWGKRLALVAAAPRVCRVTHLC